MKTFPRANRVANRIKEELAELLIRGIKDPRLDMVTITMVKLNRDLRIAKIYYSIAGDDARKNAAAEGFKSSFGYIKREMAKKLGLRYMPDFKFFYDQSFDYGAKMDMIIEKCNYEHKQE